MLYKVRRMYRIHIYKVGDPVRPCRYVRTGAKGVWKFLTRQAESQIATY